MEDPTKFKKQAQAIYRMLYLFMILMAITAAGVVFLLSTPELNWFAAPEMEEVYVEPEPAEDNYDKIENGIHQRTGLIEAEGLMVVVNNCTNCHSAQLITQNRMNREHWKETIRWMQETQNLWDLGKNEEIIIDYLVTNYPPEKKGRRMNLKEIEWYTYND